MSLKKVRIGIIGTGGMAWHHGRCFSELPGVELVACCDVDPKRAAAFGKEFGITDLYDDYRVMLKETNLDGVSNVTPDPLHARIAMATAEAGVHILSEKPLATTYAEGKKMLEAVKKAGVINMVNFSYRDCPGLQAAAEVIRKGKIGRVLHVESSYLQSWLSSKCWGEWKNEPMWMWRLSSAHGSMGALGDIGCHVFDATEFLAGPFEEIYCRLETFDKGVRGQRIGKYVFDVNDSLVANVKFKNGAIGTIHSSRWATGHANSLRFRVYGDKGGIEVDLDRSPQEYRICAGTKNTTNTEWKTVKAKDTPNNHARFVRAIRSGQAPESDFANALRIQAYMHYCVESNKKGRTLKIV